MMVDHDGERRWTTVEDNWQVVKRYKIKGEILGWNKINLKLIFLRTSFKSKLIQIKINLKIFK